MAWETVIAPAPIAITTNIASIGAVIPNANMRDSEEEYMPIIPAVVVIATVDDPCDVFRMAAMTKDAGEIALDKLEGKWGEQYPIVIKSWRDNWERLSEFFQYSEPIRKLIYTTNTVEGYHRQIRKVTKNKGVFPNDTTLIKLVYLAYRNARKKWMMPVPNWGIISQQLAIKFEDRYNLL